MQSMREKLNELLSDLKTVESQIKDEKRSLIEADENYVAAQTANEIIQNVAQIVQQEVHHRISNVVTRCLQSVFDQPYEFKIAFEQKRGRTEARLTFVRGELEVDPMSASGGGVVDVAAFSLRLACLLLIRPPVRRLLVMDEPWKHLSETYRPRMRELVETLADELNVQFLIVTHSDEFRIGKVVEI